MGKAGVLAGQLTYVKQGQRVIARAFEHEASRDARAALA